MAPMLLRGSKGLNISWTSPIASTATFITPSFFLPSKHNGKKKKKERSTSADDDGKRTHSFSPTNSSRCLLLRDDSSSSFSSAYLEAFVDPPDLDLDDPPVPGMIRIDPSRFHFSDGHGASDLNSSASLVRPQPYHGVGGFRASTSSWPPAATTSFLDEAAKEKVEEDYLRLEKNELVSTKSTAAAHGLGRQELQPKDNVSFRASTTFSTSSARTVDTTASFGPSSSRDQVVVLRVSLHCKGCVGKVRKHLSRMQGVTSFGIDFGAKKVTVVGEVTPLGVLSSVSKVKNAQLWTSPTRPTSN